MSESILVIDDEYNFSTSLRSILEGNGYLVDVAATGSEAFALLQGRSYQAVLLDLVLPDLDGIEIAEHIARVRPDTAVIVLTGHASVASAIQALRCKASDYLCKPCPPELILQTVARALATLQMRINLERSERKFKLLADAAWDGMIICRENVVREINRQCLELFGCTEEHLLGRNMEELFPGWRQNIPAPGSDAAGASVCFETEAVHGGRKTFPVELKIKKLDDADPCAWVAAVRDLTASRQEELQRIQMQEKLVNAQRMESIGIMAGSVAHDLNNILSSIVTFPELLLLDMSTTETYRKDIALIQQAGKQAAAVVADLLTVARGSTCSKEQCNLNTLLKDYSSSIDCQQLRRLHPGISFQLQLEANLPNIEASAIHITKSIINLVTNAAEAIGSEGKITIRTANRHLENPFDGYETIPPGRYAILSVQDTGSGIAGEALPHLFKPFFSKKEMGRSGTGLGLTVIWNTMRDHQGFIDIVSNGGGTRFDLYFPSSITLKSSEGETVFPIESLCGRGERILVVDDEESQRQITSSILNRLGYTACAVDNGEKAIEYIRHEPVDLLLLDMVMDPGISGYETYRRILQIQPDQRAVVASGYFNPEDQDRIRALGVSQYLTKPFSVTSLARAVQEEIRR